METDQELTESLKLLSELKQKLINGSDSLSLEEKVYSLEEKVGGMADDFVKNPDGPKRVELVANLCLLSELCGAIDFDRMIEAREKFQELFPHHFKQYLSYLENASWEMTWSGCIGCVHFSGKCALNLSPTEVTSGEGQTKRVCHSRRQKSANL
ncbi:MAG: hypothetical protein HY776_00345 [Actinobacteria bacterium]|nr:hypothetical protein [Actinomycetota bacterium]